MLGDRTVYLICLFSSYLKMLEVKNMKIPWFLQFYFRTQQALQWWSRRQSMYLFHESQKIRDGLLQESFTIRRSLECSLEDNTALSAHRSKDWLNQVEKFHYSLEQLSDRLFPAYIEEGLPLAIQFIIETWQKAHPQFKFELDLPIYWRQEPSDRSLIIVRVLDELLKITLSEMTEISIFISLKLQSDVGELIVQTFYPDQSTLISSCAVKDLEYLSQSFQFLTSGQCFYRTKDFSLSWYCRW